MKDAQPVPAARGPLPAPGSRLRAVRRPGCAGGAGGGDPPLGREPPGAQPGAGRARGGRWGRGSGSSGRSRPAAGRRSRGEEAPSGRGAAAGGSGNAGSGACPGERSAGPARARPPPPAPRLPPSAAGLGRRPGARGRASCPRGARGAVAAARSQRSPAPSALCLHPSGFLSAARASSPGPGVVRSARPSCCPLGGRRGGERGRPGLSGSREGAAWPRLPELGPRGAASCLRGPPSSLERLGAH